MRTIPTAAAILSLSGVCGPALGQPACTVGWRPNPIGNPGTSAVIRGLATHNDGTGNALYAAGPFLTAGGLTVNAIAKWNGIAWSALGSGLTGTNPNTAAPVNCLGTSTVGGGPALYAGGSFLFAGGQPASRIAKWQGGAWAPLAGGLDSGAALGISSFNDGTGEALYVGGTFTAASGTPGTTNLARWNGTQWSGLGGGISGGSCNVLFPYDDGSGPSLFAGGQFTSADGVPGTSRIARWDGSRWHELAGGISGPSAPRVNTMAVYDDGSGPALYIGGLFDTAGGVPADNIAKWSGGAWSPVGGGADGNVTKLIVFDDGRGPGLYAGGSFFNVGGPNPILVNQVARWNGTAWVELDGGVMNTTVTTVSNMAVFDDGSGPSLFLGGGFTTAGGQPTNNIVRWGCAVCYANCDGSTIPPVLNVSDFICFQTRYAAGDPYANCDNSTIPPILNVSDFICFQTKYSAGCT